MLQNINEKANNEYLIYDQNGMLIYANSITCHKTFQEFMVYMEKNFKNYHQAQNIIHNIRLKKICDGLIQKRNNNSLYFCEHKIFEDQKYHFILLKNISKHFYIVSKIEENYKELQRFIEYADFGLICIDSQGIVISCNYTAENYLSLSSNQIVNKKFKEILPGINENDVCQVINTNKKYIVYTAMPNKFEKVYLIIPYDQIFFKDSGFDISTIPSVVIDVDGNITKNNIAFSEIKKDQENYFDILHPSIKSEIKSKYFRIKENKDNLNPYEARFVDQDIFRTVYTSRMPDDNLFLLQFVDISEKKQLEQQFIQTQKMQAVGQLAGGIAHDFNNLLTAIIGYSDLLLQRFVQNDPSYTDLIQIKQNANRASNLVKQLLAFSRKQKMAPEILNVADVLSNIISLLKRLLGDGINLHIHHGHDIWPIKADFSQLEQVMVNLTVNSRDAMEGGGNLAISSSNYVNKTEINLGLETMKAGDYVKIEISDTGCGIDLEHLDNIFEPFFTTKELSSGTGLGLSTVYGIIKQSGGFISVKTEKGEGTTFTLYLPRAYGELRSAEDKKQEITDLTGSGKILFIEDEDSVRTFGVRALREKGYIVIEASSGEDALEIIKKESGFDLIITDVVMPKMDGPTFCAHIKQKTKIIFISGYSEDILKNDNLIHDAYFLSKPFNVKELASKVKEVLFDEIEDKIIC